MRKVMQTEVGKTGNCMSACLATVFGLDISDVPNFFDNAKNDSEWWASLREWLKLRGYGLITINANMDTLMSMPGTLIVGGMSPRGVMHATVWQDGSCVHDPHPDGGGIEPPFDIDLMYPLDPSKLRYDP